MSAKKIEIKSKGKVSREEVERAFWEAAEGYPAPAFTRQGFSEFLGGVPSPARLANMDSEGCGPDGGFYRGRTRMYLKRPAIEWALRMMEV